MMMVGATALVVSGCSSESGYVMQGREVTDLDTSLAAIESQWQSEVSSSDVKVRMGEDAGCYFQAGPESEAGIPLSDVVLCGPYREMGSEVTSWDAAELYPFPGPKDDVFVPQLKPVEDDSAFTPGKASPNLELFRPDGRKADLAAEVAEPDAPRATAGSVAELVNGAGDVTLTQTDELRSPVSRFEIERGVASRVDTAEGPLDPPEGGAFLIVQVRSEQGMWSEPDESTFKVTGDGVEAELPSASGVFAVAFPADAAKGQIHLEFDGLTQTLDADGKRVEGTVADGLYKESPTVTVASLEGSVGDDDADGFSAEAGTGWSRPEAAVGSYSEEHGWAEDGKVWLTVSGSVFVNNVSYEEGDDSARYDVQEVEITQITIDGDPVESVDVTKRRSETSWSFDVAVDPDFEELTLGMELHALGLKNSWPEAPGLPDRAELDFSLKGPITQ